MKAFGAFAKAGFAEAATAHLPPSSAYLASLSPAPLHLPLDSPTSPADRTSHAYLSRLLDLRAALTVARVAGQMRRGQQLGDLSWECVPLCEAVVESFLARSVVEAVREGGALAPSGAGAAERRVLEQVVTFVSLAGGTVVLTSRLNES